MAGSNRDASRRSASSRWTATSSSGTSPAGLVDRLALALASAGGAGCSPIVPGTVGSLVTAIALWLIPFSQTALLATLLAVTVIGIWAGERVERALGVKDPGVIVIDEVAGMMLSVLTLPRTVPVLLAAFVLFRILDTWKPFPAHESQALSGGLGVMVDDLVAGLYTLLVLLAARALLGLFR
jgi:phosphatidylglycerophosphatase A